MYMDMFLYWLQMIYRDIDIHMYYYVDINKFMSYNKVYNEITNGEDMKEMEIANRINFEHTFYTSHALSSDVINKFQHYIHYGVWKNIPKDEVPLIIIDLEPNKKR